MHKWLFPIRTFKFVDGDTLDATVDMGLKIRADIRVRVPGIDCPEVRRLKTRKAGEAAKYAAELWMYRNGLANKYIWSKEMLADKYGRVMGDVIFIENHSNSLSSYLLKEGYARTYEGGAKKEWADEHLRHIERKAHNSFGIHIDDGASYGTESEWADRIL